MKGSRTFTRQTANEIETLLAQTRAADRAQQKALRQKIRDPGFYISDFNRPSHGFRPEDFRELVERGVIRVT
jgi:hypothetical protein